MKEKFLHYVWQYRLLNTEKLLTTQKESINILNVGTYNNNSGPDFLNARLRINDQEWFGNVEIHLKSSDWYAHQHESDENYDAVILHVVFEDDVKVFMKNNQSLPTLELKEIIQPNIIKNYNRITNSKLHWIPCEKLIQSVDSFVFNNWIERLFLERLERKSIHIKNRLEQSNHDYEAVLFQLLAKNFGLKVNGEAFLMMATSFDFSILRKERNLEDNLSALLFGQAGFLEEQLEDSYYILLQKNYKYLKHKYKLKPVNVSNFQFFRMRPNNFPTVRLAQLSTLYFKHHHVFSKIMEADTVDELYAIFEVELPVFWETHYTFNKESVARKKKLSNAFVDLIIINTILPLQFVYKKEKGLLNEQKLFSMMQMIASEKNAIISKFQKLGIQVQNSFTSQSLLELKQQYCEAKRCLDCQIGNHLIKYS